MTTLYLDPNGKPISHREWKNRVVAEYDIFKFECSKFIARLVAADRVIDANLIPEPMHKRYYMLVTNILRTDAYGEPLPEPKYVPDTWSTKAFPSKEKAARELADFCVTYGGADKATIDADLAKEVAVTPVAPPMAIPAKDMSLAGLEKAVVKEKLPHEYTEDDGGDDLDEDEALVKKEAKKKSAAKKEVVSADPAKDRPTTSIDDDIGSW